MSKEVISDKESISLIFLFIIGSTSIFSPGLDAKKDLWLAFIIGIIMVLPIIIIYARIHYIFPKRDLFDIVEICFGKFIGKIVIILYIWYVYFIVSDIFVTYGQFITIETFTETPRIIPIILLSILCVFGMKTGIEILGRFSLSFFYPLIVTLIIGVLFLIPNMDINNLRPILNEGMKPVIKGGFSVFTFPLVQIVVFTMIFSNFKKSKSSYKVYILGLIMGSMYLATISITNILVIGVDTASRVYFPSYATLSRINVGGIVQRVEVVIAATTILGGFVKTSILLLCICKGISKLFKTDDYRFIIIPITLLVINFTNFQYESVMYYFEFNNEIWPYYNFPFQVILPIIIWIIAEIKKKHQY